MSFAHLHLHTEYSMLDGAARIEDVVRIAAQDGQPGLGITDHGVLYGVVPFVRASREQGLNPVIGIEAYFTDGSRFDRPAGNANQRYHLLLFAENETGYRNLMKLSSRSFLEGYYYKPRMDFELLAEHSEGIIATSGCLGGLVPQLLGPDAGMEENSTAAARDFDAALAAAGRFQDIFGRDNFFIEVQDHGIEGQRKIMPDLLDISRRLDAPLLATNDAHYSRPGDAAAHDVLLCIQTGSLRTDENRFKFSGGPDYYLKSGAQMREVFPADQFPGACDNTLWIVERSTVDLEFGKILLPHFPVPTGHTEVSYLEELVYEGAKSRYGDPLSEEVRERIQHELKIIDEMGFPAYFLIVWDLIRFAHERGIRTGPGRGSAAGSIVAYSLGITNLDPIRYKLIFERFLNPGRRQMPDIDMDFDERYRADVIRYAAEKYGSDHVAQIITFSTIKGKQAIRDAARVLGHPYGLGDKVAKAMPPAILGKEATLDQVLTEPGTESDAIVRDWYANAQELRNLYQADPAVKEVVDAARDLEGLRRQDSIHAAAVVISPDPLTDLIPIQQKGEEAEIVTQYEMGAVEALGLLKMDFLGLRNLSIIERTLELIEETAGARIDIDNVPLDDPATFRLLQQGDTVGVFQLEGTAMRALIRSLQPDSFNDVVALVALYRPGPMGANMHNLYADRKNGRKPVEPLHPAITPFLEDTYQIMVYQEQVMQVAQEMAGYSMAEADNLRKAMGKKIQSVMDAEKAKFVEGCVRTGYTEQVGSDLFDLIAHFAGYGFNRCLTGDTTVVDVSTGHRHTIRDLYEAQDMPVIPTLEGWTRTRRRPRHIWQNGVKPVYRVTSRSGRSITATDNHPLLTAAGWKRVDELGVGDFIAQSAGLDWSPTRRLADHELAVLGYVLAAGNTCHPSGFYVYTGDTEVLADYVSHLEKLVNTRATVDHSKSATSVYAARVDPRRPSGAVEFIDRMGLRQVGAADKHIPADVFELSRTALAKLVGAMWSGDGRCNVSGPRTRAIYYATPSEALATDLSHLLLRLGIRTTISEKSFKYRSGTRVGWQVHVVTEVGQRRFGALIGPHLVGRRAEDLAALLEAFPDAQTFRSTVDQVPAADVFPLIRREALAAQERTGRSLAELCTRGGFSPRLIWSLDRRKKGFHRDTIALMAKAFDSDSLRELAEADVWWDRIVSIEPAGEQMTYDLEVPGTHNFVANDFIVHNSHSAAYGLVAYQTAYLKAHHPAEYLAALLTATKRDKDRTAIYLNECRQMGIEVLVPDVNESGMDFTVREGRIRFGLSAIRNVGEGAVDKILEARRDGPFADFGDFIERVDPIVLNKRTVESLIKAGAFDGVGHCRKGLFLVYESMLDATLERRRNEDMGQFSLFAEGEADDATGTVDIPEDEWRQKTKLTFEKEMLGLYISDHPLLGARTTLAAVAPTSIGDLEDMKDRSPVTIGGLVGAVTRRWTKNGDPMLFFQLETLEGSVEALCFPRTVQDVGHLVVEDSVVVVNGHLDHRGDDIKVVVKDMRELEIREDDVVRLQVPATRLSPDVVARLKRILSNHPGPARVYLQMTGEEGHKVLRLSDQHRVEPRSALFAEIKELLGQKAVL
ncbi:MAG: DNA polymerase III subunit alpha [Actinomycetota bacterium]